MTPLPCWRPREFAAVRELSLLRLDRAGCPDSFVIEKGQRFSVVVRCPGDREDLLAVRWSGGATASIPREDVNDVTP